MDLNINNPIGSALDFAKGIMDRIWPPGADPNEKMQAQNALAMAIEGREAVTVQATKEIIMAEMGQQDKFTKRARPSVVYCGLAFIGVNHVVFPIAARVLALWRLGALMEPETLTSPAAMLEVKVVSENILSLTTLSLPSEFWWAWTTCVGIWSLGRSYEKAKLPTAGAPSLIDRIAGAVTGGK